MILPQTEEGGSHGFQAKTARRGGGVRSPLRRLTVGSAFGASTRGVVDTSAVPSTPSSRSPTAGAAALPTRPRVLLMGDSYTEGWGADPENLGFAYQIAKPLGWVRERFPSAERVVMGPVAPYGTPSADRANLNLALVDYTHVGSIPYVNAIAEHWFQVGEWKTMVDEEKGHPNDVGYVRVAQHVVQDLQALSAPAP